MTEEARFSLGREESEGPAGGLSKPEQPMREGILVPEIVEQPTIQTFLPQQVLEDGEYPRLEQGGRRRG
jgi:hypothetical protein